MGYTSINFTKLAFKNKRKTDTTMQAFMELVMMGPHIATNWIRWNEAAIRVDITIIDSMARHDAA